MTFAKLLNRLFGITNKRVDYFAVIFAAVIVAGDKKMTEALHEHLEEDAGKLFKSPSHQGVFVSQVVYFAEGVKKGYRDLNYLVGRINKNAKLYPRWNSRIPYYLLNEYKTGDIPQKRLFEFLHTIKPDYESLVEQPME
jgi:hypothetical protein